MELATALIWTLRIVLPIILFCIYFKFQSKDDTASYTTTSSKGKISRSKILSHRKVAAADKTVPEELSTLTLKDQTQAPSLFPSAGERSGKGGGRGGGRSNREDRGDRGGREKGERREKREPRDAEQREKPRAAQEAKRQQVLETIPADPEVDTPAAEGAAELVANQEKMHLESLLNYVAFKSKDQQRNFVIEEDAPPPPPPKPASMAADEGMPLKALDLSHTTVEKANAEAQMVLRGAINFKRVDIAKDLYEQLSSANIEVAEPTFTLMIEAAVLAKDLKSSSDFLMKMETSGHTPATDILDKVLDLYSNQKQQREQEKQNNARQAQSSALGNFGYTEATPEARTKLTSDARIFVPAWGIPPPPPKPPPKADEESEGKKEEAETADAVTEAAQPAPEVKRTALKAAAKPFEPMWNGPQQFGEPAPAWDTWNAEESNGYSKSKGGKGFQVTDLEDGGSNGYEKGRGKGNKGKANGSSDASKASTGKKWKPKETAATAA